MANVILKDVVKKYGNLEVVHGINLEVKDKEFVVLVGPSGCGKSTVLRMIAGLEEISSGTIEINNKVVNNLAPKDRDVAMVFQNYALYPHMNVYKNMAFGLKLRKMPKDEIDKRVNEAAEILELKELLHRKPHELSGGQRQRVAMGRAIVRRPAVYLFDEPLSNLDAKLRTQMRLEIKQLHQKVQNTIIYVTHDQIEAMTLADRIVIMRNGYIEQVGTPLDIFQNPANVFVAGFIGSPPMNLRNGVIINENGALKIKLNDKLLIPIPEKKDTQIREGQKIIMGLRTEDIFLSNEHEQSKGKFLYNTEGIIQIVEPLGNETSLHMDFYGTNLIAKSEGRRIFSVNKKLKMTFNLDHLHIFDAETEKSIY
ncbi:MAG: sugar transporter ATP-binding protein [Deferribacteraceae bacterium]|jgi:multiple sugar transport system ATP-binding protein|nr:sugar transporter ATP-binding protein [Deferribacteraceae bacterium]